MDAVLFQQLQQGATLVTASRHLAHVLGNEFNTRAQQQGLRVWSTPRILPWSTYLRLACQQTREQIAQPPRLLSDAQSLMLWERIVAGFNEQQPDAQRLLNPAQAARAAQRSWQQLHQYGITLEQVAAWPNDEAQVFVAWAREFLHRTDAQHWLDAARSIHWLAHTSFVPDTPLIVYGFDDPAPDMQRLCSNWQAQGAQVTQWPLPQLSKPKAATSPLQVVAMADADAELVHAAHWARAKVEAGCTRVGVIVPHLAQMSAQVQRRFTEVFAPAQRRIDAPPCALAFQLVATPVLSSHALVHQALTVLQLMLGNGDVLQAGQLLRSPYFLGHEQEADARACADVVAREERREVWTLTLLAVLMHKTGCLQLAAAWQATANAVREQRHAALPSVWTERFTHWLQLCGWGRGRALNSSEQQVQNKFRQVLGELSALDELLGKISFEAAIAVLGDACHSERFAPESVDQAVNIIAADSVAGLQFDALWVMGLHANDWPPPPQPDAFIPAELQRQHGMPNASAAATLQAARRSLTQIINCAQQVVLSWPQHADDEELVRSPLLDELATAQSDVHSEPVSASSADIRSYAATLFAARPVLETFTDEFAPRAAPQQVRGGSRVLELQSRCPFRAQAELRLGAAQLPMVTPAIEPKERGVLIHRVLAEVWQQLKHSDALKQLDITAHAHTVRAIATRHAQQVLPGDTVHRQRLAQLEVELCVQWVLALLAVDAGRAAFVVQRTEQREQVELAGMNLNIQLDRMDALAAGGSVLIDYKTGNNTPGEWLDRERLGRPRSPQLPLYAITHRENLQSIAYAVLRPGAVEYRGYAQQDDIADKVRNYTALKPQHKLAGVDDWQALLQHWQTVLENLAQQYLAGAAAIDPLNNECQYCHLASLCRKHEVLQQVDEVTGEDGDESP